LEGLGAVAYNQNRITEAIEYYKEALKAASYGNNASNLNVPNRLVEKLEFCIRLEMKSKSMEPFLVSYANLFLFFSDSYTHLLTWQQI